MQIAARRGHGRILCIWSASKTQSIWKPLTSLPCTTRQLNGTARENRGESEDKIKKTANKVNAEEAGELPELKHEIHAEELAAAVGEARTTTSARIAVQQQPIGYETGLQPFGESPRASSFVQDLETEGKGQSSINLTQEVDNPTSNNESQSSLSSMSGALTQSKGNPIIRRYKSRPERSAPILKSLSEVMSESSTAYEGPDTREMRNRFLRSQNVTKEETISRAVTAAHGLLVQQRHQQEELGGNEPERSGSGHTTKQIPMFGALRSIWGSNQDPFLAPAKSSEDTTDDCNVLHEAKIHAVDHTLDQDGSIVEQRQETMTPFDVLGTVRAGLKSSKKDKSGNASLEGHQETRKPSRFSQEDEIDWEALPLSPLLHEGLIEARNKFRTPKPLPKDCPTYDEAKAKRVSYDYLADMITSPVRSCHLTGVRLPSAFLLTTTLVKDPESDDVLWAPDVRPPRVWRSNDEPEAEDETRQRFLRDSLIDPNQRARFIEEAGEAVKVSKRGLAAQSSDAPGGESNSSGLDAEPQKIRFDRPQPNTTQSYFLSTHDVVEDLTRANSKSHSRTPIPFHWRKKFGDKAAANIRWQPNAHKITLSRMQEQITDLMQLLRPFASRGFVGACMTMTDYSNKEACMPLRFSTSILLYIGPNRQGNDGEPSFMQAVDTFVASRIKGVEVLNDLFETDRDPKDYAHVVRVRRPNGGTLMFYDLTRMLTPAQLEALRGYGFTELVYFFDNWKESLHLRQRLYMLAHYIGRDEGIVANSSIA